MQPLRAFFLVAILAVAGVLAAYSQQPNVPPLAAGYVVTQGGSIFRSTTGGRSWITQAVSQPPLTGVRFINNNTGFVTGFGDMILLTVDGGKTWGKKSANSTRRYCGVGWFDSASAMFVGGRDVQGENGTEVRAVIMFTSDVGNTWVQRGGGINAVVYGIDVINKRRVLVVGDSGLILASADAGATWKRCPSGTRNTLLSVVFLDSMTAITVGTNGTILRTTDGGTTWSEHSGVAPAHLRSVRFSEGKWGIAVGDDGTVVKSLDRGDHWVTRPSGTTSGLRSVTYFDSHTAYAVGENGTMLKSIDGGDTWSSMDKATTETLTYISFADKP